MHKTPQGSYGMRLGTKVIITLLSVMVKLMQTAPFGQPQGERITKPQDQQMPLLSQHTNTPTQAPTKYTSYV